MIRWNRQIVLISTAMLVFNVHPNRLANVLAGESATGSSRDSSQDQAKFMQAFQPYCGQAFAARIMQDSAPNPDWDHPLVVHIRDCEDSVIRMPLQVGADRSRTWVLTFHSGSIDFQHIHLHQDGSPDCSLALWRPKPGCWIRNPAKLSSR